MEYVALCLQRRCSKHDDVGQFFCLATSYRGYLPFQKEAKWKGQPQRFKMRSFRSCLLAENVIYRENGTDEKF